MINIVKLVIYVFILENKNDFVINYYFYYFWSDWKYYEGFNVYEGDWKSIIVFFENNEFNKVIFGYYVDYDLDYEILVLDIDMEDWGKNKKNKKKCFNLINVIIKFIKKIVDKIDILLLFIEGILDFLIEGGVIVDWDDLNCKDFYLMVYVGFGGYVNFFIFVKINWRIGLEFYRGNGKKFIFKDD